MITNGKKVVSDVRQDTQNQPSLSIKTIYVMTTAATILVINLLESIKLYGSI